MGKKDKDNTDKTDKAQKEGQRWPQWAVILVVLVCIGFLGFGALLVGGSVWFSRLAQDCGKPEYVANVASQICSMDKLPPDFKPVMAVDAFGLKFFSVSCQVAGQRPGSNDEPLKITVGLTQPLDKMPESSADLTKMLSNSGVQEVQFAPGFEVATKGQLTVAGEPFAYVTGQSTLRETNTKVPSMIGTVLTKDKKKALVVFAHGGKPGAFDLETTKRFLSLIKSI